MELLKAMRTTIKEQARLDARLPKEQKIFFERAAYLGGFRNLTDFVIIVAQEKAKKIFKEKEQIIASGKDCQIFFDAIAKPKNVNNTATFLSIHTLKYNIVKQITSIGKNS